jgi:two-component system sensor histidine kinase UhpB
MWESYKAYIVGTGIVVSLQLLLIVGLLVQRARRRRAKEAVLARESMLQASYERSRQVAAKLINAEEEIRAAIARDLHDGACQELAGLVMAIDVLKRSSHNGAQAQVLSKIQEEATNACEGIRRLSHDLHPATLRLLGLASAMKAHCGEVEKRHGVFVSFRADGDFGDIQPDKAVSLFRIVQESLRNGIAHGDAGRLAVSLERSGEYIDLTITDDGCGFDIEAVRRNSSGLGLVSIEERARMIGADVRIVSSVGRGTIIRVRWPAT